MKKQQGVVLFFSLIVLLMMTVIGVALAVNSSQSLRMAGAGSERVEALAAAQGAQARAINNNQGSNMANIDNDIPVPADATFPNASSVIVPSEFGDVNCQRSADASSTNLISCRRMEITTEAKFGRDNLGRLSVVTGVEQEVLTGS
ncbi:pilus assembly PilX N-terminal domain-containing protein [Shewanella submarina]|uniref:PilX N-terminal domain-containing pilus assembly protein n=1 Tax=Shewanella submarina TaxID=2016376 RepID=A0ABV7GE51_9GAMM|nr:pilus assembly PilX N-terminal domain-containing protein [Shewanella submarina]MCL1036871.1 pilus assembly PilX N-terminal domain-containing protein [Shewanella submarina]